VEAYAIFCGPINQPVLVRIVQHLLRATTPDTQIRGIHLLFQSSGGTVGDCVCLYNLFRSFPLELTLYNAGSIQSGAVTAYLGARRRIASPHAQFMIHRSHCTAEFVNLQHLESTGASMKLDDDRTEAILRAHTRLPDSVWRKMNETNVFISGAEAVAYGLADEIGDFAPAPGAAVYFV
jgi:ATP-dependent Clp protease, protease subunit